MKHLLVLLILMVAPACANSPTGPDPLDVGATPLATQASHESPSFGGRPIQARLTGDEVVDSSGNHVGDLDGSAHAHLSFSNGQHKICYVLIAGGIDTPTGVYIHRGIVGEAGPQVANISLPSYGPATSGCASVDPLVGKEVFQDPAAYYLNVVTAPYPQGAIRGQLGR